MLRSNDGTAVISGNVETSNTSCMRYLLFRMKRFCGFSVGFVFFVSGLLKLMDPVGAGLVMKEYFHFLHIGFLDFAAKPIGAAFALAEAIIGAGLVTGVWRKFTARLALILQVFFTVLTILLVIFNPEMDCGCFGEAIHLSHMETFLKNITILALLLIYYIPVRYLGQTKKKKYVSFAIVTLSVVAFGAYSWMYLPMADFTAFSPGTALNGGNAQQVYESSFIYEKDGRQETFSLDALPDTTWTFVRTETMLKSGREDGPATISIYDGNGTYADSLLTTGRVLAVTVYNDKTLTERDWRKTEEFLDNAAQAGFRPLLISVDSDKDISGHYHSDYKAIITLNRSNGGVTYLDNGHIIRKWAQRKLPDLKDLATLHGEDSTDTFIGRDTSASLAFQGFLLYVFAVMLLL